MTPSRPTLFIGIFSLCFLSACLPQKPGDSDDVSSSQPTVSSQASSMSEGSATSQTETKNVSYRGVVEEVGVSTYMQGTHQLRLMDERAILLESTVIDLDTYIGKEVEVFGGVRPTVEAGGLILRVERVSILSLPSASTAHTQSEDAVSAASAASEGTNPSQAASSIAASAAASSSSPALSADIQAQVQAMARENLTPANWTRSYCSPHMGFCFPVHRNWWFHSFGATSSLLWHVEIGNHEISSLGEGPISVNLVNEPTAKDGLVEQEGDKIIGYKMLLELGEDRHFQVIAPVELKDAVEYITHHLHTM